MRRFVIVIDHGVGNSIAIKNSLKRLGHETQTVRNLAELDSVASRTNHIILPGVGAFDEAMKCLIKGSLDAGLKSFVESGGKILGICLGMQLLFEESDEGSLGGLGLIPGRISRIHSAKGVRVPHVGWERVIQVQESHLFKDLRDEFFYHNHSFALQSPSEFELAKIDLVHEYAVAVNRGNVYGVQFHPEKSHSAGSKILENFINI
jgi:glutamine amidotransferase